MGCMDTERFRKRLDSIGLVWVTVLLVALASSLVYLGPSLWQTWTHDGETLVNPAGFLTGHDFVAFYAASQAALAGDAALVYQHDFMAATQVALVGSSDIGYLAFMYPPTYLLLISPLSALPYFPALALWQAVPFVLFLLLLRRIALPPIALIMAAGAPAVAQALFAGQNGILLSLFLGGGLLALDRRPLAGGVLLALAAVKPQLAVLIVPALIANRQWRALAALLAVTGTLVALSAALFGPAIWIDYLAVPGQAREYLALGQLPWSRMPAVYTSVRLAGLPDSAGVFLQLASAAAVVTVIFRAWRKNATGDLRIALLLAGVPLATPFMYDYDLPFMLFALALFLAGGGGRELWERILLLAVWLQPVWWWWILVDATGISVSPVVYGVFFAAIAYRIRAAERSADVDPGR